MSIEGKGKKFITKKNIHRKERKKRNIEIKKVKRIMTIRMIKKIEIV